MTTQDQDAQPKRGAPKPSGSAEANALRDQIDRSAIDRSAAGDKVAASDPAAVPLGTDDEAAGNAPTLEEARSAQDVEVQRAVGDGSRPAPAAPARAQSLQWKGQMVMAAAVLLIAGLLVWLYSMV